MMATLRRRLPEEFYRFCAEFVIHPVYHKRLGLSSKEILDHAGFHDAGRDAYQEALSLISILLEARGTESRFHDLMKQGTLGEVIDRFIESSPFERSTWFNVVEQLKAQNAPPAKLLAFELSNALARLDDKF